MKKRILLFITPLVLACGLFLVLSEDVRSDKEVSKQEGEATAREFVPFVDREARLRAMAEATYVEDELSRKLAEAAGPNVVAPRRMVPQNYSGVPLDNIPAGVSRVEEVLFESTVAEEGGHLRRSRVLKTDFHYPLLQTVELLKPDPESGGHEVVAYQSMVADHVLTQIDLSRAPENWIGILGEKGLEIRREITRDGLYTLAFPVDDADTVSTVLTALPKEKDWVEYAEADFVVAVRSHEPDPNDPAFSWLWGLHNTGQEVPSIAILLEWLDEFADFIPMVSGTPGMDINAIDGWAVQMQLQEGRGEEPAPGRASWFEGDHEHHVVVAVLDTGINYRHLDLKENIWVNPRETRNANDDSGSGYVDDIHGVSFVWNDGDPMDFNGHGTHVAGTIGAVGHNQKGMTGVAWDVRLMGVQFLNEWGGGVLSDAVLATDYAWQNGAHVLNNSWGFDAYMRWLFNAGPSLSLARAIQRCRDAGAIFVVAAGNDGFDVDIHPDYPGDHQLLSDNVVNVGSMEPSGNRSIWQRFRLMSFFPWEPDIFFEVGSNYGREHVHVFAPGSYILSTYLGQDQDTYAFLSGTSMAAPHVAGMYALLKAEYPDEPYNVLVNRLLQRADQNPRLAGFGQQGRMADLAAALDPAPLIFDPFRDQEFEVGGPVRLEARVSRSGDPQTYEIYRNGERILGPSPVPLPAAASDPIVITYQLQSAALHHAGVYRLEVTSPHGTSATAAHVHAVRTETEIGASVGAPYLAWRTAGDSPWQVDFDGARSGPIGDNEFSQLTTTVTGPGTLTFRWRVSSEHLYDRGRFLINGSQQQEISGESGWLWREYELPVGTHDLLWVYFKDGSRSAGQDALWLADVDFLSDHPVIIDQSQSLQVAVGQTVTLSFEATGADPLTYYWRKDEQLVSGVTGPVLVLPNIQPADAATYVGVVGNSHGVARTVPISVNVVGAASAPVIEQHPESFFGVEGQSMTVSAAWTATYPYTAQWYKDGEPLSGENRAVLSLDGLTTQDSGRYTIVVTNAAGDAESHPAFVTVYPQPVGFSEWQSANAPDSEPGAALLRYSLGLDAESNAAPALPRLVVRRDYEVRIAMNDGEVPPGPGYAALEFDRPLRVTGVRYLLEASTDLVNWTELEAFMEPVGEPDGRVQRVRLREIEPRVDAEPRRFLRLRLEVVE